MNVQMASGGSVASAFQIRQPTKSTFGLYREVVKLWKAGRFAEACEKLHSIRAELARTNGDLR